MGKHALLGALAIGFVCKVGTTDSMVEAARRECEMQHEGQQEFRVRGCQSAALYELGCFQEIEPGTVYVGKSPEVIQRLHRRVREGASVQVILGFGPCR